MKISMSAAASKRCTVNDYRLFLNSVQSDLEENLVDGSVDSVVNVTVINGIPLVAIMKMRDSEVIEMEIRLADECFIPEAVDAIMQEYNSNLKNSQGGI